MAHLNKKFVSKDDINFRWKPLDVSTAIQGDNHPSDATLQVSNERVPFPSGLAAVESFVSEEDSEALFREINSLEFTWEGFEQRRRVQRYSVEAKAGDGLPATLRTLVDRIESQTGRRPQHVSVEEYSSLQTLKITQYGSNGYNGLLTGFECIDQCQCPTGSCSCFVAQIPLRGSAVKHLNKPKRRHPSCFDLESSQHWTDIRVDANGLILQTGECLWNWRSRVSALPSSPDSRYQDTTFLIIKLYSLPAQSASTGSGAMQLLSIDGINFDTFGYMGKPDTACCSAPMPPLEDILTIIVTTSPIQSNPSTEVIETTFDTFLQAGADFACKCRKVLVCDGYRVKDQKEKVSRRHTNPKQAMRNGIVTDIQAENYTKFKAALRELCANAQSDSALNNTVVHELEERQGYGFALRHALHHCVTTPYVCVIQHDRTFMRPTPMAETMRAMWHHRHIKYVTMSMRSNLMYRDIFQGKYGKTYHQEFDDMVLRLPELNLEKDMYGPESNSAKNVTYITPKVRGSIETNLQKYLTSKQALGQQEWLEKNSNDSGKHQLTLTPVTFWYDNVHIAETAHYRDFVFDPNYKMVKKGGFVEDKLSPVLTRTLEKLGLREGHARFGCYLLDDHSGLFFTGHLDGGNFMTRAKKLELEKKERKKQNS